LKKRFNIQKALILMAALNILLVLSAVSITIYVYVFQLDVTSETELYILPVISLLSLSCAVATVLLLRPVTEHTIKLKQTEDSLEDLNTLNNTLRAQRHDFMNHLQVVHGLIELGEHAEVNDYIKKVYNSIERVNGILKTGIPAVNAILEAKRRACTKRGIEVSIDIRTDLSEIPIPAWELCRLLGNIIDNSVNALSGERGERFISIEIYEDMLNYRFKIANNGPAIPRELWNRIFDAGFTTRKLDGEGMGLTICKAIIDKYGGRLWVASNENETVFEGVSPRNAR